MKSRTRNNSCRIGRPADQQRPRPPAGNQAGIEKSATGTNSTHEVLEDIHNEENPHRGPLATSTVNPSKVTRQKWTREEYKQVMEAFYKATNNPSETTTTKAAYNIWRLQNPTARPNLDANKLANVRRNIIKSKRLIEMELETIRANVRQTTHIPEELNRSRLGIEDTDKQEMVEANVDENTSTLPDSAGRTQKPTETKPEESMIAMKMIY